MFSSFPPHPQTSVRLTDSFGGLGVLFFLFFLTKKKNFFLDTVPDIDSQNIFVEQLWVELMAMFFLYTLLELSRMQYLPSSDVVIKTFYPLKQILKSV